MRALHWFRSDLRLRDNVGLAEAARLGDELVCVFVLDDRLLESDATAPARRAFLWDCLERLDADLRQRDQALVVRQGDPRREIPGLLAETKSDLLTFNRDYGPFARARDEAVASAAEKAGVQVVSCKDRVVFESSELLTGAGDAYRVFTPYRNAWWKRYEQEDPEPVGPIRLPPMPSGVKKGRLPANDPPGDVDVPTGGEDAARRRLKSFLTTAVSHYERDRDLPAKDGTSRLSPYLRLGAVSVRTCVAEARERGREDRSAALGAKKWCDELIWRDFYHGILADHPHVLERSFKSEYDQVKWKNDDDEFAAWCQGRTGYPIVDAGMRQLAGSAWMHNRVRMIVASFLTKDLLVDWRRGERFFLSMLVDGDPASNNGGWQWAASTGTDAQPYFRIFNPVAQGERWDPEGEYVRRWVPELEGVEKRFVHQPWKAPSPPADYPAPIVDHASRRQEALRRYEAARKQGR